MKKLLIILAILLLGGIGYFTYQKWGSDANLSNWLFVPENAILVYESPDPLSALNHIQGTKVWANLSPLPLFATLNSNLHRLDTLAGAGNFSSIFAVTNTHISLHPISKDAFDFLFIAEIDNFSKQVFISKALDAFKDMGYHKKSRKYLKYTITEIYAPGTPTPFTFIFYKNFFVCSFTAFLVEDAIRAVVNEGSTSFNRSFSELMKVTQLTEDAGNLYINFSRFNKLLGGMSNQTVENIIAHSGFLDLNITEESINLSGFTFTTDKESYLSGFLQNPGSSFDMAEVFPMKTAWVYHYNLSDLTTFSRKTHTYISQKHPQIIEKKQEASQEYDLDINYIYEMIDEELALITLEPIRHKRDDQLLILKILDMSEALRFFNGIGERESAKSGDTVYVEQFGDYEIRKLPIKELPEMLLGSIAHGFEDVFYLQHRNYLVFSNNLLQLKNLTLSIQREDTWSKSLHMKTFLDQANRAANLSLFINTSMAWKQGTSLLNPKWQNIAEEHQFSLKNLEFASIQFSAIDSKFYTNVNIHQSEQAGSATTSQVEIKQSIMLAAPVPGKPTIITNHNTREKEVIVQDTSNYLHHFATDFSTLWSKELDGPIVSSIEQIDYYSNGKLQVVFATKEKVHLIDRTGAYIPGYPKPAPGNYGIQHFSIIDYDNSRKYRLAIADQKGNVFLNDKDLNPLDGWNPKTFTSTLTQPLRHYRIGKNDVMIAIQTSGQANVLTRKGTNRKPFPLDFETPIEGEFFISEANSLSASSVILLSQTGELLHLSLAGQLEQRDQLYKPATSTNFLLINDVNRESFIIVRRTERRYEFLDDQGEILFKKDYYTSTLPSIQYYKLGGGDDLIIVVDKQAKSLYIYNMNGLLMTGRPLTANGPVSIMKSGNEYVLYRANGNNVERISVTF